MFSMSSNRHSKFDVVSDVTSCISGTVGIVDGNRDHGFVGFELMLVDKALVDGAAGAAAVKKSLSGQGLGSGDGIEYDVNHEVGLFAFEAMENSWWLAEFVEAFSSVLSS